MGIFFTETLKIIMYNKMKNINYIFQSSTRPELVKFITAMALAIDPALITSNDFPFVIRLRGARRSGKSLFWDQFCDTLLGNAALLEREEEFQDSNGDMSRVYNRKSGAHIETKMDFKIFSANTQVLTWAPLQRENALKFHTGLVANKNLIATEDSRKVQKQRNRADVHSIVDYANVAILSNEKDIEGDIQIELNPPEGHTVDTWDRTTLIMARNPELKKSPKFQGFLDRYCEIV